MTDHNRSIKVAFATDDGTTISAHFGRARFFEVVSIENGVAQHRERREKNFHGGEHHQHHLPGEEKGTHDTMIEPIQDCQVAVARGMGEGMFLHLREAGLSPLLTDTKTIDEAVAQLLTGSLEHNSARVHHHH